MQPCATMVLMCSEDLTTWSDSTDSTDATALAIQDEGVEAAAVPCAACVQCGKPLRTTTLSTCLRFNCSKDTPVASLQQEDVPMGPYARTLERLRREARNGCTRRTKRVRGDAGAAGVAGVAEAAADDDAKGIVKKPYAQLGKRSRAMQLDDCKTDERGVVHWNFKGSKKQEYPETAEVYDRKVELERLLFDEDADWDADGGGAVVVVTGTAWKDRCMAEAELFWLRAGYKHPSHTVGKRSESLVIGKYLKKLERALSGASYNKRTGGENSLVSHGPLVRARDDLFSDELLPQTQPPTRGLVWEMLADTNLSKSDIQDYISMIKAFRTCVPRSGQVLHEERTCARPRPVPVSSACSEAGAEAEAEAEVEAGAVNRRKKPKTQKTQKQGQQEEEAETTTATATKKKKKKKTKKKKKKEKKKDNETSSCAGEGEGGEGG